MPKTNPPKSPNNYGVYGVLVILFTVGYHHYFAIEISPQKIEKFRTGKKIENSSKFFSEASSKPTTTIVDVQKNEALVAITKDEDEDALDPEFINDNDRENCWDYIHRNLGTNNKSVMEMSDKLAKRLLNKYPATYLFGRDTKPEDVNPQVLTKGVIFASALKDLKMLNSWHSEDMLNPDRGINALTSLHNNEPENSAYLVYLALAYEQIGNYKEIGKVIAKINQTSYFTTYKSDFTRDLYELPKDINEFIAAEILFYSVPEANIYKIEDLSMKYDLSKVAFQIFEKHTKQSASYDTFDADTIEYSVAYDILKNRNPEITKKYLSKEKNHKQFRKQQYFNYGARDRALAKECEVSSIYNLFVKSKEFLAKNPAKPKPVITRTVAGK